MGQINWDFDKAFRTCKFLKAFGVGEGNEWEFNGGIKL
jgi:hypothetical protein